MRWLNILINGCIPSRFSLDSYELWATIAPFDTDRDMAPFTEGSPVRNLYEGPAKAEAGNRRSGLIGFEIIYVEMEYTMYYTL